MGLWAEGDGVGSACSTKRQICKARFFDLSPSLLSVYPIGTVLPIVAQLPSVLISQVKPVVNLLRLYRRLDCLRTLAKQVAGN